MLSGNLPEESTLSKDESYEMMDVYRDQKGIMRNRSDHSLCARKVSEVNALSPTEITRLNLLITNRELAKLRYENARLLVNHFVELMGAKRGIEGEFEINMTSGEIADNRDAD